MNDERYSCCAAVLGSAAGTPTWSVVNLNCRNEAILYRSSATKWLTYSSLIRSSAEIPACFNMPDKVPVLSSLCSGTTHPLSPRRRTTWLPRCRTSTNPSLINALQQSLPAIRGSLGMGQLKAGHHGRGTKVHGELLQKQSSRLLEVCHSFG